MASVHTPVSAESSAAVTPPAGATAQANYSGTARQAHSETMPDNLQRDMQDPVRRMEILEEMWSSDDPVHTAIDARRQEINAANWALSIATSSDVST